MRHSLHFPSGGAAMTYFSLLYQNSQQENQMKEEAKQQLFTLESKESERRFEFTGTRMVEITEKPHNIRKVPCYFDDLNINQIIDKILHGDKSDENLPVFYELIKEKSLVVYRQDIFKDLNNTKIYESILNFKNSMVQAIKFEEAASFANHPIQQSKYLNDAMNSYFDSIHNLITSLDNLSLSEAFHQMYQVLKNICEANEFSLLHSQIKKIEQQIEDIYYSLTIFSDRVIISFDKKSNDFSRNLRNLFAKQCNSEIASSKNMISFFNQVTMNDLELKILEIINQQYHAVFEECILFTTKQKEFMNTTVLRIYKEINFYLSCSDYITSLKQKKYNFSYPEISNNRCIEIRGLYDVSLALKSESSSSVVTNDFLLNQQDSGTWITGANQGGKTTFARSIGQIAYLTAIGLPVPAVYAKLPLFHGIFTHFSIAENATKSNGKLKEELLHLKELLEYAKHDHNLIILNELFSSSTSMDAYDLSLLLTESLIKADFTVVCVTHIPRLAASDNGMISMATTLDDCPDQRTYQIIQKEAELTAHANDIAKKYQLSYDSIICRAK